jgi:hypothetical protein
MAVSHFGMVGGCQYFQKMAPSNVVSAAGQEKAKPMKNYSPRKVHRLPMNGLDDQHLEKELVKCQKTRFV